MLNKRRQECLTLEKELIKEREVCEQKSREVTNLLQRLESIKLEDMQAKLGADLNEMAQRKKS